VRPAQNLHQVLGEAQLERERGVRPPPFEEAFQAQGVEAMELGRQGALSRPWAVARRGAAAQLRRRERAPSSWTASGSAGASAAAANGQDATPWQKPRARG